MNDELDVDEEAYDMLFSPLTPWPCLSLDFVLSTPDGGHPSVGDAKKKGRDKGSCSSVTYPLQITCVAGSQAAKGSQNEIYLLRKKEHVVCKAIKHPYGGLNRIKTCKKINSLIATWCDDSKVYIYELSEEIRHLDERPYNEEVVKKPLHVFGGHTSEGFSLDWNPVHAAKLLSGDNDGNLFLWLPDNNVKWTYERLNVEVGSDQSEDNNGGKGKGRKKHSIEDVQWSKGGNGFGHVFAMCSSDKSVRIIDTRDLKKNQEKTDGRNYAHIHIADAHAADVNVISWNENVDFLIASGGDDSVVKIWDTRNVSNAVGALKFHKRPISAVSWNQSDTYVILAASLDNSISIWDLSVETESLEFGLTKHPDQLLFEHLNQKFITDAKFHPLHPGCVRTRAMALKAVSRTSLMVGCE
ncbi:WD domain G-beta repeat domain containing protein [Plasmodium cynomolgi strain B]|uniref:WD domain G-beta repeat domain containing protein n=1 Tax=Plasmodium cynomolgi (strain B) TaxID=1120755 RepID=K6UCQ1_PLACD|nr:WD domain G-beta repeat domain containing protein [Plasmodium cynomolgi strain B]GAB65241.1 WD domain G-beta repeat domain containing protein [Plasmodium cynomolgi strain B]